MHEHRGMTLVETAVIVATLAAGAALTAQGVADAARQNRELKDSLCLRQIHSALLVKAASPAGHRVAANWDGGAPPPAWIFLHGRRSDLSSTALRAAGQGLAPD